MIAEWKVAVVVRDDLATWQKLNVTAFVMSGVGIGVPELIGDDVVDGSGVAYLPKLALPCLVYAGDAAGIRRAFDRARSRALTTSVYTDDLFSTMNDVDNRAAIAAVPTDALTIAGFSVAGHGKQVDKVFDKLKLHP